MANNEHLFPQEQFQPILERSMALDGLLPADEICLAFKDIKKGDMEIKTCYGDIYKIVNAMRDYSRLLLLTCDAWELTGFHRALSEYHAQKAREIADKYQAAIGYDYDKALEKCRKKKTKNKDGRDSDIGGEALELLLR